MLSSDLPSVVAATGGFFPVYRSSKCGDMWYVHLEDIFTAVPIGSTPFCIAILTNCGETPKADAASLTVMELLLSTFVDTYIKKISLGLTLNTSASFAMVLVFTFTSSLFSILLRVVREIPLISASFS